MLEVEVGIHVDNGIIAHLDAFGLRLVGIHAERGAVGGGIIRGEVAHVAAQLHAQHLGNAEQQVEVGVEREFRQGHYLLVGRRLIGHLALPVERAQREVLAERGTHQLQVARRLTDVGIVEVIVAALALHQVGRGGEVGIFLHVLQVYLEPRAGFLARKGRTQAGRQLLVQIIVVPPEPLRVVGAVEEGGLLCRHAAVHLEAQAIAQKPYFQQAFAAQAEVAPAVAVGRRFGFERVIDVSAAFLEDLSAQRDAVLAELLKQSVARGQFVGVVVVLSVEADAGHGPFVETFVQFHPEQVGDARVMNLVEGRVTLKKAVQVEVAQVFVGQEAARVVFDAQRVQKTRHGHELRLQALRLARVGQSRQRVVTALSGLCSEPVLDGSEH